MTRCNATPGPTAPHYTRGVGTGEAGNRVFGGHQGKTLDGAGCTTPPNPKEITMLRIRSTAILALALSTLTISAQAETATLAARIHDAAVTACAPERATGTLPNSHYGAIDEHCVYRISRSAMEKYQVLAKATQNNKLAAK